MICDFRVDDFLGKQFHMNNYNCWHLVREAWLVITGVDLGDLTPTPATNDNLKETFENEKSNFQKLESPQSPCIVLMERKNSIPHVGIYWKKRVLQIVPMGVEYQPLDIATRGFRQASFYTCIP